MKIYGWGKHLDIISSYTNNEQLQLLQEGEDTKDVVNSRMKYLKLHTARKFGMTENLRRAVGVGQCSTLSSALIHSQLFRERGLEGKPLILCLVQCL